LAVTDGCQPWRVGEATRMSNKNRWMRCGVLTILVLAVCGIGWLVVQLWVMGIVDRVGLLDPMEEGEQIVAIDPELLSEAVTEVDYDTIARKIIEQRIGHRDLNLYDGGWIHSTCSEIDSAPEFVYFNYSCNYYWLTLNARIRIFPHQSEADWYFTTNDVSHDGLDLSIRQINIPQAIQIIEANGGKDFCQAAESDCKIRVNFRSANDDEVWLVRYGTRKYILCGFVNAETGSYSIHVVDNTDGSWFCPPPQ